MFGIDRDDNALRAEVVRGIRNKLRGLYGSRVHADLIGTCEEHCAKIFNCANPASDRQRHEALLCSARDNVHHGGAVIARSGDVKKDKLIGALSIIKFGALDRVARVAKVEELGSLNNASRRDVQTGDNPLGQHRVTCRAPAAAAPD